MHRVTGAVWFSGLLALAAARQSRADDSVSYKYQNYQESDGRIRVIAHYARAEKSLGDATTVAVQAVIDTITGASPSGQEPAAGATQVPTSEVRKDIRRGEVVELQHKFAQHELTGQFSYSKESDYISRGVALTDLVNFNQKNTVLQLGYAHTDDDNQPRFFTEARKKRSDDFIVGVNQILDPRTSLSVDLTYGRSRGYLSDPYKIVSKDVELLPGLFLPLTFPENRPAERTKWILFTRLNRFYDAAHGALDVSYRFFHDDWGIDSHTFHVQWLQKLGERFTLVPSVRLYDQSAADFYHVTLNGTTIMPAESATGRTPFYTADYRMTKFRATTVGLKLVANFTDHLTGDLAYSFYSMRGRDGVTLQSAFCDANIVDVGLRWNF